MKKTILVLAGACAVISSTFAKTPADAQTRLDAFVRNIPGGVALVWADAEGVAFFQAGKFSETSERAITSDTQFEIGSVTKVFTALLLAESERAGKAGREDPVATYLLPADDDEHDALKKITLLTLTTHTSGLPRLQSNFTPTKLTNPYVALKRADLVEGLRLDGPRAMPGRAVAYSNFGVALLGEALAEAWHMGYAEALTAKVLEPLGMKATVVALPGTIAAEALAPGHDEKGHAAASWELDAYAPAGALRSSAREMGKFLQAAIGDEKAPLHAAFVATTTVQRAAPDAGGSIGLGWFVTADEKRPIFWHNGGTGGYRSFVGFTRAGGGAAVAVLTNHAVSVDGLGFALLAGKPAAPTVARVGISLPAETLALYAGEYRAGTQVVFKVAARGNELFVQLSGQGENPVFATAVDEFFYKVVDAQISFLRDAAGKITGLVLHQNGRHLKAARVE